MPARTPRRSRQAPRTRTLAGGEQVGSRWAGGSAAAGRHALLALVCAALYLTEAPYGYDIATYQGPWRIVAAVPGPEQVTWAAALAAPALVVLVGAGAASTWALLVLGGVWCLLGGALIGAGLVDHMADVMPGPLFAAVGLAAARASARQLRARQW